MILYANKSSITVLFIKKFEKFSCSHFINLSHNHFILNFKFYFFNDTLQSKTDFPKTISFVIKIAF